MALYRPRRAVGGGIASGVYTTDSASQLKYLVNDSDSRFLFVENDEQLDKYLSVRDEMPGLSYVIVYDREGLHGFADDRIIFLDDLYRLGRDFLKQHPGRFEEEIARSTRKKPRSSSTRRARPAHPRAR
jgi:long-chain acyl-CoA synthetase